MRILGILLFSFWFSHVFAQSEGQTWLSLGTSGELIKRLDWNAEYNMRMDTYGVKTIFPEVGLEYKISKLLKSSVDYRLIYSRNTVRNYTSSNRINLNISAKEKLAKRLYGSLRMRYQFGFKNVSSTEYDADFDQAFRIKPKLEYDIKNFPISPSVGTELFFSTNSGTGKGFSKMRTEIGGELEGLGNHAVSLKYMWEYRPSENWFKHRHILSLSYAYRL